MDVKFRVQIRPNFKFYATVAVYSRRASSLALISLVFTFISYILSSTFNLSKIRWQLKFNKHFMQKNDSTNLTTYLYSKYFVSKCVQGNFQFLSKRVLTFFEAEKYS